MPKGKRPDFVELRDGSFVPWEDATEEHVKEAIQVVADQVARGANEHVWRLKALRGRLAALEGERVAPQGERQGADDEV